MTTPRQYVVLDLPEAIWMRRVEKREPLFSAHTRVSTIWDKRGVEVDRPDGKRSEITAGSLIDGSPMESVLELECRWLIQPYACNFGWTMVADIDAELRRIDQLK